MKLPKNYKITGLLKLELYLNSLDVEVTQEQLNDYQKLLLPPGFELDQERAFMKFNGRKLICRT